ncbi:MAG: type IV pilin protein [Myxococcota bacterium]
MPRYGAERGFTLVELMVVVVILAVLATVAVAGYGKYKRSARRGEGVSAVNDIRMKQETFYATYSRYEASTDAETSYTPETGEAGELTGHYVWDVECPDPNNAWCNLGFEPPLHRYDSGSEYSFFKYQTIGWAPGRTAPSTIQDTNQRWLHIEAIGLPNSQTEYQDCTVVRFTSDADDTFILTEQSCKE